MPSVAIVAGEASGDASGAALANELRRLYPGIRIWGAGGTKMRDAGVELAADFSRAGAIGIFESLKLVPWLIREQKKLKELLLLRNPDVFVPIDFGAFNVPLGKFAREQGIKTVYYFPPGSWRRRPRDHSSLVAASDRIVTPFPWSAEILRNAGADAVWLGHPMLDSIAPKVTREEFLNEVGELVSAVGNKKLIGLLPGSRSHEIDNILPAFLDAGALARKKIPEVGAFLIAAGSERAEKRINDILRKKLVGPGWNGTLVRVFKDRTYDIMAYSDLLLTCSGTATLEAMILGAPMVIVYRGSAIMRFEYIFRKKILEQFAGMPNIIAGREICPELLGDAASPEAIAEKAVAILSDPIREHQMRDDLMSARHVLGEPGATAKAARIVAQTAGIIN